MEKINVAVITPTCKDYMQFINNNLSDKKEYIWVYCMERVIGKKFDDVIKLYQYYKIEDINEVLAYIESHGVKPVLLKTCLTEGSFTVDRKNLVNWAKPVLEGVVARRMIKDLIMGSEFVITAQDLLDACDVLPAYLVNEEAPEGIKTISTDIITITYKQPEDEILPTTITK